MGKKRKSNGVLVDEMPDSKRIRQAADDSSIADPCSSSSALNSSSVEFSGYAAEPRTDPTYGQRGALPGLDDVHDDSEENALTSQALEYLRSVRSEASAIPHLLVAPKRTVEEGEFDEDLYDSGYGDSRGFYSDGAYVAAPVLGPFLQADSSALYNNGGANASSSSDNGHQCAHEPIRAQSAYYQRLAARFVAQRQRLHTLPPAASVAALQPGQLISVPASNRRAFREWFQVFRNTDPSPVQLASMETATVLRLLKLVTSLLRRKKNIDARFSSWIWGLLGKLNEVGTLGSEEVGVVRELGKRAVWVGCGFAKGAVADLTARYGDEEGSGMSEEDHVDDDDPDVQRSCSSDVPMDISDPPGSTDSRVDQSNDPAIPADCQGGDDGAPVDTVLGNINPNETLSSALEAAKASLLRRVASSPTVRQSHSFVSTAAPSELDDGEIVDEEMPNAVKPGSSSRVVDPSGPTNGSSPQNAASGKDEIGAMPDNNTLATLDMIITIAGEFYGQRDLLEFREAWAQGVRPLTNREL